jgi:hypothetical protein
MNRTLPLDHPLVKIVADNLARSMHHENPAHGATPWIMGVGTLRIIAELVSASLPQHYLNPPDGGAV